MAKGKYQPLTLAPINFSLTEGTSIPAPADTPPDSPRKSATAKKDPLSPLSSHPTPKSAFFPHHEATPPTKNSSESAAAEPSLLQQATTNDASSTVSPSSPSSKRPSSVRRFLGLRSPSSSTVNSDRPGSPATIDSQPSLRRRKSGSWFGKGKRQSMFIAGSLPEGKESSPVAQTNGTTPKPAAQPASPPPPPPQKKGPPPPALPELKSFGVSSDLGAEDMFKGIN